MVETALVHNPQLLMLEVDSDGYDYQIDYQKKQWLPTVSMGFHADWEKNQDGTFSDKSQQLSAAPRVGVRSPLGTQLNLQVSRSTQEHAAQFGFQKNQWQVDLEQPLLKGARSFVHLAPLKTAIFEKKLGQRTRTVAQSLLIYSVFQEYTALYQSWRTFEIQKKRFETHKNLEKVIQQKIKLGRMAEVDGISHQVQLAQFEQLLNQSDMRLLQQSARLAQTLGLALQAPQPVKATDWIFEALEDEQFFQQEALESVEVPLLWELDKLRDDERLIRDNNLWDVHLKATMREGRNHHWDPNGQMNNNLDQPLYSNRHRSVGVFVNIPLNHNQPHDVSLYLNRSSQYKKRIDLEARKVALQQQVSHLYKQVSFWSGQRSIAKKSYELAQKSLNIEQQKYLGGFSTYYDWQRAQEVELQTALEVEHTLIESFMAQIELYYVAGLLPKVWQRYAQK